MRQDYADITLVLDSSGSMAPLTDDTIGGVNNFITAQKALPGFARFTLVRFSTWANYLVTAVPIEDVQPISRLTYYANGGTALLDAVGRAIDYTGDRLLTLPEDQRPARVLFVVLTDGQENQSTKFTKAQVQEKVERQTRDYKWEFLFLGADLGAFKDASDMGIGYHSTAVYNATSAGIRAAVGLATEKVSTSRTAGMRGMSVDTVNMSYTVEDRKILDDAK